MDDLKKALLECVNKDLYQMILSNSKEPESIQKIKIRPILLGEEIVYQLSKYQGTKVFHENLDKEDLISRVLEYMSTVFKQMELEAATCKVTALISKKGKCTIKKKTVQGVQEDENARLQMLMHNRKKKYLLEEGKPIDFLVELGVLTQDGKIVNSKYDKWKQINRYLEFIEDILPVLPKDRVVKIIDFGCGKSYLTFAMYHYLKNICGYHIQVTGLDLKEDVINTCNKLAEKFHYDQLHFIKGDIAAFEGEDAVDMVVTLHACDTATDYAIYKAIQWNARVILSVPCCQHEVNRQIKNKSLEPVLKYGLLQERIAALVTDGIRAELLEEQGYDAQILEFIDMEHTPKNILIRGVKRETGKKKEKSRISETTDFLSVHTTLQKLLESKE